ncbi:MAG TPA: DNA polymerase III subunit gamma/tau [Patescibacteria group bacterium]|nr:DNA polymerase III subunit gamma/tau [Patescibacteria group bacterium]
MPTLSQKYRPKTFAEITGQNHVTETLRKEVETQTLGHAYLFSGPRGIGKTTTARVFAKALNCEHPQNGEPCNACVSCLAANNGQSLDIIELDAATHTGVDTVREAIVEHVRFSPLQGKRKIYILDEVHMFSSSSWNALLKTLEEPPSYAFFILATTEWHKVPATIISRCQRFEFKRVSPEIMTKRLTDLAKQEGWEVDPEVIQLIVTRADGFVRDAETLLGQLGSLGEAKVDAALASLVIPPSHLPLAAHLLSLWADRDHAGALKEIERLFDEGVALLPLFDDLITIIRRLLSATADPQAREKWINGAEDDRAMAEILERFSPAELSDLALLLLERRRDVKSGVDPLFALELASTAAACGLLKHVSQESGGQSSKIETMNKPAAIKTPEPEKAVLSSESAANKSQAPHAESETPVFELSLIRAKWNQVVSYVEEKNHSLPFILKISRPEEVRGTVVVIRFQYAFHRDKILNDLKNRRLVEECLRTVLGNPACTIEGVVREDTDQKQERSQDIVHNIISAFGGTVIDP